MSEFDNIWVFFASLAISFESSLVSFWETWLVLAAAAVSLQGFAFATSIANPPALHDDAGDDDESADGCVNKFVKRLWLQLIGFPFCVFIILALILVMEHKCIWTWLAGVTDRPVPGKFTS